VSVKKKDEQKKIDKIVRKESEPIEILDINEIPEKTWYPCHYRIQLIEFLKSSKRIGIVRHPIDNNMAAASSVGRLTRTDPELVGKVMSMARRGRVYVMKLKQM
jgi:hypothetical protein